MRLAGHGPGQALGSGGQAVGHRHGPGALGLRGHLVLAPLVEEAPPERWRQTTGVRDAEVQEVRVMLGEEVSDPHDPLGIPEGHGGHGALPAPHLGALAHAASINDRRVIRKDEDLGSVGGRDPGTLPRLGNTRLT
jgi:hypothetical protein